MPSLAIVLLVVLVLSCGQTDTVSVTDRNTDTDDLYTHATTVRMSNEESRLHAHYEAILLHININKHTSVRTGVHNMRQKPFLWPARLATVLLKIGPFDVSGAHLKKYMAASNVSIPVHSKVRYFRWFSIY